TKETCEWSSSSINIVDSTTFFDGVIFTNLGDGALKIGNKGLVTLKDSVSFYGNNPIDTNGNKKSIARNIICQGVPGGLAQLLANTSSFKEVNGEVSKNKWILADKDYCIISGSLNNEKTLLFTPEIQSITAKGNKDKTGIDVELKGKSLFKCGKLFLLVSLKSQSALNDDITSKEYPLEDVAQTWDDEETVLATILEDDLVKKGVKLSVSVRTETKDGSHQDAEIIGGGKNIVDVEGFGKGGLTTTVLIIIIVVVVVVVLVIVIVLIIVCVYCMHKRSQAEKAESNYQAAGSSNAIESNNWDNTEQPKKKEHSSKHHHKHGKKSSKKHKKEKEM
ncbi:MAG: hypothetical protein EZS28_049645, partial [Streblomastix strix]